MTSYKAMEFVQFFAIARQICQIKYFGDSNKNVKRIKLKLFWYGVCRCTTIFSVQELFKT